MVLYIIICSTFLMDIVIDNTPNNKWKQRVGLFIIWVEMTLLIGLRGLYATPDTYAYYHTYSIEPKVYTFLEYAYMERNDIVYYLISYLFSIMGIPWQLYLVLLSGFYFGVIIKWIDTYSIMPFMSLIIYECFFMNMWMIALRSAMAFSFLLLSYMYIDKHKTVKAIIFFLLAVLSHGTAILFAPFFFVRRVKLSNQLIAFYTMFCIFTYIFRDRLLDFLNNIAAMLGRHTYSLEEGDKVRTFLIILVFIMILGIIFNTRRNSNDSHYSEYLQAIFCAVALFNFVQGGVRLRIVFYYAIFMCLLIPILLRHFKPVLETRITCMLTLCIVYIIKLDISKYYLFWNM